MNFIYNMWQVDIESGVRFFVEQFKQHGVHYDARVSHDFQHTAPQIISPDSVAPPSDRQELWYIVGLSSLCCIAHVSTLHSLIWSKDQYIRYLSACIMSYFNFIYTKHAANQISNHIELFI